MNERRGELFLFIYFCLLAVPMANHHLPHLTVRKDRLPEKLRAAK